MNAATQHSTMTPAAAKRWQSINANARCQVALYEIMHDGGFVFGVNPAGEWRTFAVNADGGRAYPITY